MQRVKQMTYFGESFQDYSLIQDFEPDFPQKGIKETIIASLIYFQSV